MRYRLSYETMRSCNRPPLLQPIRAWSERGPGRRFVSTKASPGVLASGGVSGAIPPGRSFQHLKRVPIRDAH